MTTAKLTVFALLFSFFCLAGGVGGLGGGPSNQAKGKLITVLLYDGGESGEGARLVTYRELAPSTNMAPECFIYHGEIELPCSYNNSSEFMKNIYEKYIRRGVETKVLVEPIM